MNDETAFLDTIRQTPIDETARLVYADWLEERGDALSKAKASFIRLEARMAAAPEEGLNQARTLSRLRKFAAMLPPEWLAVVSHPRLEACRFTFEFQCPKQWERLAPTDSTKTRFCDSCQRNVYFCDTLDEAREHVRQSDCVAVCQALVRRPDDLYPERLITMGFFPPDVRCWPEDFRGREEEEEWRNRQAAAEPKGKKKSKGRSRRGGRQD